jgi:hypothetical protein
MALCKKPGDWLFLRKKREFIFRSRDREGLREGKLQS